MAKKGVFGDLPKFQQKKAAVIGVTAANFEKKLWKILKNKSMKFYLNNPNKEVIKSNQSQIKEYHLSRMLENKYKKTKYSEKWRPAYMVANVSSFVFNLYSFVTGAGALTILLSILLYPIFGTYSIYPALIFSVCLSILLEIIKRNMFEAYFSEYFSNKGNIMEMILTLFSFTALSVILSFLFSYTLPGMTLKQPEPTQINKSDFVTFESAISYRKEQAANIKNSRSWKGKLSNKDQAAINNLNYQIDSLENKFIQHKNKKELEANQATILAISQYESNIRKDQYLLGYFTIATEILFIICFFYKEKYLFISMLERAELATAAGTGGVGQTVTAASGGAGQTVTAASGGAGQTVTAASGGAGRIGFKQYEDMLTETVKQEVLTETVIDYVTIGQIKPCLVCGKDMLCKSIHKKYCSPKCRWEAFRVRNNL